MARIAVAEPSPEVRGLIELAVSHAGHETVPVEPGREAPLDCDVLVLEPGDAQALATARAFREARPEAPIVCVSIYPRGPEAAALDPVAYVVKPFRLAELASAVREALEQPGGNSPPASGSPG